MTINFTTAHKVTTLRTWYGSGHRSLKGLHGRAGDLSSRRLVGARLAGSHHVGLEERSLEVHVVVVESLVNGSEHCLCDLLGAVKVVCTVWKNLERQLRHGVEVFFFFTSDFTIFLKIRDITKFFLEFNFIECLIIFPRALVLM